MILFDCERLRKPFTGQYTYCKSLAEALAEEAKTRRTPLGIYAPEESAGFLPDIPHKVWHRYQKYLMLPGRQVQLFHVSNPLSLYIPRLSRIPLITTIHDLNFLHYTHNMRKLSRHADRTDKAYDRSDCIITISEFSRQDILSRYGDRKRVEVIYNGVDPYEGPVHKPANVPDGPFLLSVCRIAKSKNLHILPVLLEGNDLHLVLVGKIIDQEEVTEIMEEGRKRGVADRIHLTGPVPEADKHWYLRHCTAFLFSSLTEGFGLPIIEAMLYYKPVFCSDRTAIPEVGGDCAFYFNHAFDPDGMKQEFERGMRDFQNGKITPEAMRSHTSRFSWKAAARKYYDVYESLL